MNTTTSFWVVPGKHKAWEGSDFKGVVSASVDGEVHDVSSGLWPIPFEFVIEGLEFTAVLQPSDHPKYGRQYAARSVDILDARYALSLAAMRKILTPALIKRLRVLALKFGKDVFDKIVGVSTDEVPVEALLGGSPNVTHQHVRALVDAFETSKHAVNFTETFPPMNTQMALKYADILTVEEVRANPYKLFWTKPDGRIDSNPLHVADDIAKNHLGVSVAPNDDRRLAAYFEQAVKELQRDRLNDDVNGSIWFDRNTIKKSMLSLQSEEEKSWRFDENMLNATFDAKPEFLAEDDRLLARSKDDAIERILAARLVQIQRADPQMAGLCCLSLFEDVANNVNKTEAILKLDMMFPRWKGVYESYKSCDTHQRSTLQTVVEKRILILMGGAGTGKSTTLCLIVRFAQTILGVDMKACALTGKAVDRLKQLFSKDNENMDGNIQCRTLHSLAVTNEYAPVDALAIDEASMAFPTILSKIISESMSYLIICGDDKQLPSIDAGAFLRDIVASGAFPTVRLEHIYRTGEGSGIATEAPKIFGTGETQLAAVPIDKNGFKIVLKCDIDDAINAFRHIVRNSNAPDDVVMISNTRRTCKDANRDLQPICNPVASDPLAPRLLRSGGVAPWIVGDRVISNENFDLDNGQRIFNGMIGCVKEINTETKKVLIRFRDLEHQYDAGDRSVDHAYCVTTWKFQGSEISHAIVFFDSSWGLSCELLYTAVTRGQLSTTAYLSTSNFKRALATRIGPMRVTRLVKRINAAVKKRIREEEMAETEETAEQA